VHINIVAYKGIKIGDIDKGTHMALHYMLWGLRKLVLNTPIDLPTNMEMVIKDGRGIQGVERKIVYATFNMISGKKKLSIFLWKQSKYKKSHALEQ